MLMFAWLVVVVCPSFEPTILSEFAIQTHQHILSRGGGLSQALVVRKAQCQKLGNATWPTSHSIIVVFFTPLIK